MYKTITNTTIVNTTVLTTADLKHLPQDICTYHSDKKKSAMLAINNTVKAVLAAISRIRKYKQPGIETISPGLLCELLA